MKKAKSITVAIATMAAVSALAATALKVGDKAPAIDGKTQDGKEWKLADYAGKKAVLVYFYPKDNTPGCTKEACGLRDRMDTITKQDVVVLGVSVNSAESHKNFIEKHQLNFPLLVDPEGKVVEAYGAKKEGSDMARRVSFLIGKDGTIKHITDNPDAEVHLKEMSEAMEKLGKTP